jgi:integrase
MLSQGRLERERQGSQAKRPDVDGRMGYFPSVQNRMTSSGVSARIGTRPRSGDRSHGGKIYGSNRPRRGYSAHSMRATFITTALESGAQLEDVQKAAGHRDPSTTKLYDRRG